MMKAIAFFDFDGTISTKDSLADFIQYAVGKVNYYAGLLVLSPMLIAYTLKFIPNDIAKEKLLGHFFKGWNAKQFQMLAERYSLEQIDEIIRPKAIEKIRWHQNQGHQVVIVSASMDYWLRPWCGKNDLGLIATRLEVKDNKLTGRFATKNCYGLEKANRVNDVFELSLYEHIYAYGDSDGDKELLALADESFYKPFRNA
jgi:HAD superfamily hydrolase (TIGR01490 family)